MTTAREAFQRICMLEGRWRGRSMDGKAIDLSYEVTGKNSAVIERYRHVFKGELMEDEMVTVYHLDGDALVLTHYCTLGSQPRMQARLDEPDTVAFEFVSATNLPHPEALRMTGVTFRFQDVDHFTQTWFWNGKKCHIRPENRSDDFHHIPDDGLGMDVFVLERMAG